MDQLDPGLLAAMSFVLALLVGASFYTKFKIRQLDRRIAEREAAEAAEAAHSPSPTTR